MTTLEQLCDLESQIRDLEQEYDSRSDKGLDTMAVSVELGSLQRCRRLLAVQITAWCVHHDLHLRLDFGLGGWKASITTGTPGGLVGIWDDVVGDTVFGTWGGDTPDEALMALANRIKGQTLVDHEHKRYVVPPGLCHVYGIKA